MPVITQWPVEAKKRLQTYLQAALVDDLDANDPTRVAIVSNGRYLESPDRVGTVVEIYENDPDDSSWSHTVQTRSSNEDNPGAYVGTTGRSSNYLWRRFVIRIIIMKRGIKQVKADEIKGSIISRIEKILLDNPHLGGLKDDAGEQAIYGQLVREDNENSGKDNRPIWRSKIWIQFSTYRRQI